jgi:hypothetical protein
MGRLFGNRATRSLMRRTKWYLGLLDFLGLANFVGPDELEEKYGDMEDRIAEYEKTEQSKQYAEQDLKQSDEGSMAPPPPSPSTTTSQKSDGGMDPVSVLMSLFGGGGTAGKIMGALK